jgi:hypothetical protein
LKILGELKEMVGSGAIHWDGGETRPAPVGLWEQALDAVIERSPKALTSHNYLRHTAWEMAASVAAQNEREQESRSRTSAEGRRKVEFTGELPPGPGPRRKSCYTCASFRPPKGCAAKSNPVGGNHALGCREGWTEKFASVGELAERLAAGLKGAGEGAEGG